MQTGNLQHLQRLLRQGPSSALDILSELSSLWNYIYCFGIWEIMFRIISKHLCVYCTHWVSGLELRLSSILIINASANDYQCDNDGAPPTRASLHLCIVLIKQLIHSCPWLPIRPRCAALLWAIQLLHFDIDTFDSHVTILRRDNLFRKIPVIDKLKGKSHCNSSMWPFNVGPVLLFVSKSKFSLQ